MTRKKLSLLVPILACLLAVGACCLSANAQSFAYVSNFGSNNVSIINTSTNAVVSAVPVGNGPKGLAITPNGAYVYVANYTDNTVSVISTATNSVTASIPVGINPAVVAITPNGASAYVTNYGSNSVSVINTATNMVTTTVPVGSFPIGVAITPNGALAYVANQNSNSVSVISTASNNIVTTVPVGTAPAGVAITPDGTLAYVANQISTSVSVISTATNAVVNTIVGGAQYPVFVAITPNGAFAYMTIFGGAVVVINTANETPVVAVPVGNGAAGLAITSDGSFVYVANQGSNNVSVISTSTNTVTFTIPVGSAPFGVAITPAVSAPPVDDDSAYSLLSGGNTFTGDQTVKGRLTATGAISASNLFGDGFGLFNLNPANLAQGTANISITGNAMTATAATNATFANSATNAAQLNGIVAGNYARLDIGNNFTGNQSVTGNLTIGTGGTPIAEYVSVTDAIAIPALTPGSCMTFTTPAVTGYIPGTSDMIALGLPSVLVTNLGGIFLMYQAWETTSAASPTITIQVCNPTAVKYKGGATGTIRVDIFKH